MIKIVLYGPESTGKTTLAKQLAQQYKTSWVPEYMRTYLEQKWNLRQQLITREDLVPIAKGQLESEIVHSKNATKILICDTNLLELQVYSQYYYNGYCPEFIIENAAGNAYNLYILTDIDIPWESDILRDRPSERLQMFRIFEEELITKNLPYIKVSGNEENRLKLAVQAIDNLLKNNRYAF